MPSLDMIYKEQIIPEFLKAGYKNAMAVPKITKVIVNVGIGKNRDNEKYVNLVKSNLAAITGQIPVITKSRLSISGFKVREGDSVGLKVTLRGKKMYDFLSKLTNIALPRLRDFRGLNPKSIDRNGNFTIGVKEHLVFPEIAHEADNIHGLEITMVSTSKNAQDTEKLITMLGFPFFKKEVSPSIPLGGTQGREKING